MNDFDTLLGLIDQNKSNPEGLADIALKLSVALFKHSEEMASADLKETQALVGYLDGNPLLDKKMSVAESEARAKVDTNNEYKLKKVQYDAIVETIQTLKKKIEVLSWEIKNSNQ